MAISTRSPREDRPGAPAQQATEAAQRSGKPARRDAELARRDADISELVGAFRQVLRAAIRLRGRDTHLPGTELSHAQCELLAELHDHGELSAGELAAAAQLSPATVTQMLDHLADTGHVERARSERDRRVVVSRLTARGRREIEAKRERFRGRWEQALSGLDSEDLRATTRTLTRLRAVFEDGSRDGAG
jgi:DNA-binding MarR family transcriptional regulator